MLSVKILLNKYLKCTAYVVVAVVVLVARRSESSLVWEWQSVRYATAVWSELSSCNVNQTIKGYEESKRGNLCRKSWNTYVSFQKQY